MPNASIHDPNEKKLIINIASNVSLRKKISGVYLFSACHNIGYTVVDALAQ